MFSSPSLEPVRSLGFRCVGYGWFRLSVPPVRVYIRVFKGLWVEGLKGLGVWGSIRGLGSRVSRNGFQYRLDSIRHQQSKDCRKCSPNS